jgi:hypothetical protein
MIMMTTGTRRSSKRKHGEDVKRRIATRHAFSTEDPRAVIVGNNNEEFARSTA